MKKVLYSLLCMALPGLTCVYANGEAHDFTKDRYLLEAYLRNDMSVWRSYIDSASSLAYEYGYCAALMDTDKESARPYVSQFRKHVEENRENLPVGHYEMYMSAVYVYELRLHESFHPVRSLEMAREAVRKAPDDPMTLTYCGMALFYAPKPFGNKKEALQLFQKAQNAFMPPDWYNCWWRPAAMMYIAQCLDKQGNTAEAVKQCQVLLDEYPGYVYIRDVYLPELLKQ